MNNDGTYLFCTCGTKINILDVGTGKVFKSIEQVWNYTWDAVCSYFSMSVFLFTIPTNFSAK